MCRENFQFQVLMDSHVLECPEQDFTISGKCLSLCLKWDVCLRIFHGSISVNIRVLVITRIHKCNKSPNCSETTLDLTNYCQIFRQKSVSKNEGSL